MKMLSNVCLIGALAVIVLGVVSKYVIQIATLQPASYLLMAQVLLLLSLNFLVSESLNKK
jgi:hypothetical protein